MSFSHPQTPLCNVKPLTISHHGVDNSEDCLSSAAIARSRSGGNLNTNPWSSMIPAPPPPIIPPDCNNYVKLDYDRSPMLHYTLPPPPPPPYFMPTSHNNISHSNSSNMSQYSNLTNRPSSSSYYASHTTPTTSNNSSVHWPNNDASSHAGPSSLSIHYSINDNTSDADAATTATTNSTFDQSNSNILTGKQQQLQQQGPCRNPTVRVGRRSKPKEDRQCSVCGDKALSCNFDAISCESCKAFFRRNASKGVDGFKCPYLDSCVVAVATRRMCKRCRLRKCFEVGMKKEYILSVEERQEKKMKIFQNKLIRKLEERGWLAKDLSNVELAEKELLNEEEITMIDEVVEAYDASLWVKMQERTGKRDGPSMTDLVNLAELSIRRAIEMFKRIKTFRALEKRDQITLLKNGCIELLVLRGVICFDPVKQRFLDAVDDEATDSVSLHDLFVGAGEEVGHAFGRLINTFLQRIQCSKVTMLLLLIISLFSVRAHGFARRVRSSSTSQPNSPTPTSHSNHNTNNNNNNNSNDDNNDAASSISPETKLVIEDIQIRYTDLMKRYLMTYFTIEKANQLFPQIIVALSELRILNEYLCQRAMQTDIQSITPLMSEMLDLPLTAMPPTYQPPPGMHLSANKNTNNSRHRRHRRTRLDGEEEEEDIEDDEDDEEEESDDEEDEEDEEDEDEESDGDDEEEEEDDDEDEEFIKAKNMETTTTATTLVAEEAMGNYQTLDSIGMFKTPKPTPAATKSSSSCSAAGTTLDVASTSEPIECNCSSGLFTLPTDLCMDGLDFLDDIHITETANVNKTL